MGAFLGLAVAAVLCFWLLSDVLLLAFAGILVGIGLRSPALWLQNKTGLPVKAGVGVVCLAVLGFVAAFVWLVGPSLNDQASQLLQQIDRLWSRGFEWFQNAAWAHPIAERVRSQVGTGLGGVATRLLTLATSGIGLLGSTLVVAITGIYLALGPRVYVAGLVRLFPLDRRPRVRDILFSLGKTLELWLLGRLIDMVLVVAATFVGLVALGTPLPLALAVFAGVLNFIPYIGAVVGAVPAIAIAFGQGPGEALWVTLLFVAIQTVEGYVLAPYIQKKTVDLPAALTILSQAAFGALFGFLGLLLAPALATVLLVLVRMAYVEDVLEKPQPG